MNKPHIGTRLLACIALLAVSDPVVIAQDKKPSGSDSENEKLVREIGALREELSLLRKALQDSQKPKQVVVRKGTGVFPDGKKREFSGVAGVRISNIPSITLQVRLPDHLLFITTNNAAWEKEVPIADLNRLEIIEKADKWSIMLEARDGRKVLMPLSHAYEFYIDIQWVGELGVDRYAAVALKNVRLTFEK